MDATWRRLREGTTFLLGLVVKTKSDHSRSAPIAAGVLWVAEKGYGPDCEQGSRSAKGFRTGAPTAELNSGRLVAFSRALLGRWRRRCRGACVGRWAGSVRLGWWKGALGRLFACSEARPDGRRGRCCGGGCGRWAKGEGAVVHWCVHQHPVLLE